MQRANSLRDQDWFILEFHEIDDAMSGPTLMVNWAFTATLSSQIINPPAFTLLTGMPLGRSSLPAGRHPHHSGRECYLREAARSFP
jgi:hypothetical protein